MKPRLDPDVLVISQPQDIVLARSMARQRAMNIGFGLADQTRLVTAVSELTRNVLLYAGNGMCHIADCSTDDTLGITVQVEDQGPGIPDLAQAMEDGYSSRGSLGAGLPGARRLMDSFAIESTPEGTILKIGMFRHRPGNSR